jgi:dipeptidyl aminopeptidase/acylaminoacyl peptidase
MNNTLESTSFLSDGLKLMGFLTSPSDKKKFPGVLFIHGGGRYTENLYASWQAYLLERGYASFSFYCRGVGTSEGIFEDGSLTNRLKDAEAAYRCFISSGVVDQNRICVAGSSMGAHVAVRLIEQFPKIKAVFLQSAAAYSIKAESLRLNESFTNEIRNNNQYEKSPVFSILNQYTGALYVVYGEHDSVIPDAVKELYNRSIQRGEYRILKHGTHKLLRPESALEFEAREELYSTSVNFLQKYL